MDCSTPGPFVLLSPDVCSDSCPLSWWCCLTISSFSWPLLLLLSIFPSIRVFSNELALHIRWPKDWSFSFSISPSNEYSGLIPLGLTGLISLQSKGLSGIFSSTTIKSIHFSMLRFLYGPTIISIYDYWKNHSFEFMDLWWRKVMFLLFNTLSRFVINFLPRSKPLFKKLF